MNIGEAARRCGLGNKTIRYYETLGLVVPKRSANGYRDYRDEDVVQLRFLQHCRSVGFSLDECRELLTLYRDPNRRSAEVKALVMSHVEQVEAQLEQLEAMRTTLLAMANQCQGDEHAECAIIDSLARPMPFKLV
ncbi:Cu(I)-responsive transcriptional regulator [Marinimicrobium sp. ARAG 43.8]|uniref:Cu(I)-responsive transcriptional regulator n=1 Tax=Marinimicrobium sp. ARAG 43.8 TaxID=3418719 RepID=UPI003CEB608B